MTPSPSTRILAAFSMFAAMIPAQQEPKPAPQLAKLKALEGHWEGSGSAHMQPGAPATQWTAVSTYEWALGGFWLQCDTAIEFAGMGAMRLREYLGWDGENQRYINLAVGNSGEAMLSTAHLGDGEMVLMMQRVKQGQPEVERAHTKFTAEKMDFKIAFFGPQGGSTEAVEGTLRKVAKVEMPALSTAGAMAPVPPQMAKIAKMAGVYEGKGEMIMAPGAPPMAIGGRDTMTMLFGGGIMMTETKGTAGPPYEAHGFHAWSPMHGCYKIYSLDSMGMICDMDGRLTDTAMICTSNCLRMGMPCAARCVVSLDKNGKPAKVVNHSCMGDAPPMQDFTMTYTPGR
jgi:hypothetical protein